MKRFTLIFAAILAAACLGGCGGKNAEEDFSGAAAMRTSVTAGGVALTVTEAYLDPLTVAPERGESVLRISVAYEGKSLASPNTALMRKNGEIRAFFAGDGLDYLGFNRPANADAYVRFCVPTDEKEFLFTLSHKGESVAVRILLEE